MTSNLFAITPINVSGLGALFLQVFLEFALQSPIISLQAPHHLQAGGQVIIQALPSLLLTLGAPYARQTLGRPHNQAPGPPAALDAGGVGHGEPGAQSLVPAEALATLPAVQAQWLCD